MKNNLCIVFCLFLGAIVAEAQTRKPAGRVAANNPKEEATQAAPKAEEKQESPEEIERNREIDAKYQAIEKGNYSLKAKEELNEELYRASGRKSPFQANLGFANINFKPRYLPTALLDKWYETLRELGIDGMQNIVTVNNAVSLDFNNYGKPEVQNKLDEMLRDYKVAEKEAILYLLPQLSNEIVLKLSEGSAGNSLKLFFAYQPELYNLLPLSLLKKLKTAEGMKEIVEMQRKYNEP
jgi:hypothetical protein